MSPYNNLIIIYIEAKKSKTNQMRLYLLSGQYKLMQPIKLIYTIDQATLGDSIPHRISEGKPY